jgi:hypothetical protein
MFKVIQHYEIVTFDNEIDCPIPYVSVTKSLSLLGMLYCNFELC